MYKKSTASVFNLLVIITAVLTILTSNFASAQTFLDRQNPDSFRIANYNVHFDDLFEPASLGELTRFVNAVNADVYTFQEAFLTTSSQAANLFDQIAPLSTGSWQVHKGRNQLTISRYGLSLRDFNVPNGSRGIAMAQVDLPDQHFSNDMYILNNHFPCCDNGERQRVAESTAIVEWLADALSIGDNIDLAPNTAVAVVGDLNIVGGPDPLNILLDGIGTMKTDWDGSSMTDANPTHNAGGVEDYTWRNDFSPFDPGILDYILYTDSVISVEHSFVLNPSTMSDADLATSGLIATDMMRTKDINSFDFDHLPLIVDFAPNAVTLTLGDCNQDGIVNFLDISPFISFLSVGEYLAEADVNQDGVVDFLDISPFIALLSS